MHFVVSTGTPHCASGHSAIWGRSGALYVPGTNKGDVLPHRSPDSDTKIHARPPSDHCCAWGQAHSGLADTEPKQFTNKR